MPDLTPNLKTECADVLCAARGRDSRGRGLAFFAALAALLLFASGCAHHKATAKRVPPQSTAPPAQPVPPPPREASNPTPPDGVRPARIAPTPAPPGGVSEEDREFVAQNRPISSEEGFATWYTAPYKGRKSANGQVFSDSAMTAAHRTLPMGSLIAVTNLVTGQSAIMRVTDRGPFVDGRILDLSIASAKATGVYRAGLAHVRVDVYIAPKPIGYGGRWCVQIGAFHSEHDALKMKEHLLHDYPGSNVIEFSGEDSYWVRIRPENDDRAQAELIARHLRPSEGDAFLTRLD